MEITPPAAAHLPSLSGAGDAAALLIDRLAEIVGPIHVLVDQDTIEPFRHDMQPLADAGQPLAVVRPRTTAEVAAVLRACSEAGTAVVPRGAGSGMTGAANAVNGAVTMSLTRMTDLAIDAAEGLAVVQPGVVTLDLKEAAAKEGWFYAPDPTSSDWCTIGGNLANGSAGPCGAKYGVTGDAVRSLEVVLASGEILNTGQPTLKGVTGYDLKRLFVGSEGTLGIITAATLVLRPKPSAPATCIATFASAQGAVQAVTSFLATGSSLSLLEIMDGECIGAVEKYLGAALNEDGPAPGAVLFGQCDAVGHEALDAFARSCEGGGADLVYQTEDQAEGEMLMGYWHGLEPALESLGTWILHEVTVPRSKVDQLIEHAGQAGKEFGVFVGVHGHAADGTVHPMIVMDPDKPGQREAAALAYESILDAARDLGGPVTGEHGIGRMKGGRLHDAIGETALSVHRAIKAALDPQGLLNPGCMGLAVPVPPPAELTMGTKS